MIKMTRLFLFVMCTVLLACKPGIPKDIIQPTEMENILYDIHVLDGYVGTIPTPDSARKASAPLYKGIFKKYGIDSAAHAHSMAYYYKRPDLLSKMYDRISNRINKEKDAELKKQEKETKSLAKKKQPLEEPTEAKPVDTPEKATELKPADTLPKAKLIKRRIKSAPKSTIN